MLYNGYKLGKSVFRLIKIITHLMEVSQTLGQHVVTYRFSGNGRAGRLRQGVGGLLRYNH